MGIGSGARSNSRPWTSNLSFHHLHNLLELWSLHINFHRGSNQSIKPPFFDQIWKSSISSPLARFWICSLCKLISNTPRGPRTWRPCLDCGIRVAWNPVRDS
jgi:hypothetical protein